MELLDYFADQFTSSMGKYSNNGKEIHAQGNSMLESAMRCYVASKIGNDVEIPDDLIEENNG